MNQSPGVEYAKQEIQRRTGGEYPTRNVNVVLGQRIQMLESE